MTGSVPSNCRGDQASGSRGIEGKIQAIEFARTHQIAQRFMRLIGYPHWGQFTGPIAARQLLSIAPVAFCTAATSLAETASISASVSVLSRG